MNHRPYTRSQRVAKVIKEKMGEIVTRRLKDPRIGFVSITRVEVSSDLRKARIYISVCGDEGVSKETMEGLERAKGFIRQEIGQGIRLRYLPEIFFLIDPSIKESFRIKEILDSLPKGEP